MGRDRVIDPATGDYRKDGRGGYETTRSIATAVYHQLHGELDQWVGDADAGCGAFRLRRLDSSASMHRFKTEYEQCLQVFVDDGRAADLVVEIDRLSTGKWAVAPSLRDVQYGEITVPIPAFGA
jgi:phage gp46-like protein